MKRILFMLSIFAVILTGCGSSTADATGQNSENDEKTTKIGVNFVNGNVDKTITYNQSDPLTMPDGKVIKNGDLKPVWQVFEENLNLEIVDNAIQDQTTEEMMEIEAATRFEDSVLYGGNNADVLLDKYGTQGYFINLKDYEDQLPNFFEMLDENPGIEQAITAYDGGIYYIPYIAEIGNYARVYHARQTWVTTLLDSDENIEKETETLNIAYEPYWTDQGTNVIELQNNAAKNGVLDSETARNVLIDYINEEYDYDKPSELYLGEAAQYDMDELVALFRVVKLHPNTLTKQTTGNIVEDAYIAPFFVRQTKYREDLLRFITYFGGQRVFGADSYNLNLVYNADGKLELSYATDDFLNDGIERIKEMYSEGLIAEGFSDLTDTTNFRTEFYGKDDVEGHQDFGFMTDDFIASTTTLNDDVAGILPPVTTLPTSNGEMVHFIENTRTIKADGWGISSASSDEEINAALKLMDYVFTDEGSIIQIYGTNGMVVDGEVYTGPDGIDYPKFDNWAFENADKYKSGDMASFLPIYIGALLPIGYPKEIGFEYQYTTDIGFEAFDLYTSQNVIMPSYDAEDPFLRLTPSAISLTEQQYAQLSQVDIGSTEVDQIFMYIIGASDAVDSAQDIKEMYIDKGLESYEEIYNAENE